LKVGVREALAAFTAPARNCQGLEVQWNSLDSGPDATALD
jgi:hypothetical protein